MTPQAEHAGTESSLNRRISSRSVSIRGIAMLAIVLYHYYRTALDEFSDLQWSFSPDELGRLAGLAAENPSLIAAYGLSFLGYLGVPVFFILSGWGLAYSQIHATGTASYLRFLKPRLLKLLPMYYLSLGFFGSLFLLRYLGDPGKFDFLLTDLMLKALLVHNFFPEYTFTFNSVYWFVPTLLGLYLIFPFLYQAASRKPYTTLVMTITFSYLLSAWMLQPAIHMRFPAWAMGAFPLTRVGEFTLGISIAIASERHIFTSKGLFTSGLALALAGFTSYLFSWAYPLHNLLLGSAIILVCLALPEWKRISPWRFIGLISFPLFLFHRPFIAPWLELAAPRISSPLALPGFLILLFILCYTIQYADEKIRAKILSRRASESS